jgi:hypothetical protein
MDMWYGDIDEDELDELDDDYYYQQKKTLHRHRYDDDQTLSDEEIKFNKEV